MSENGCWRQHTCGAHFTTEEITWTNESGRTCVFERTTCGGKFIGDRLLRWVD